MITDVYDARPPACSAPYVVKSNGVWFRYHPGYGRDIAPSWQQMDESEQLKQDGIEKCINQQRRSVFL